MSNTQIAREVCFKTHDTKVYQNKAKCVLLCCNNKICAYLARVAGVWKGREREFWEKEFWAREKREGRVSPAPKTPFPKTPSPFPFKRLPRRLTHIRDLRHTKHVVQACRERAFTFTGADPGFFSKRGLWVLEFKATVPGPKKWGSGRGRVVLDYVDFRGINLSNVRRYIKD